MKPCDVNHAARAAGKTGALLLILLLGCESHDPETQAYIERLQQIRQQKDQHFAQAPNSPLPEKARDAFRGLRYFRIDPELRFTLPLYVYAEPDTFGMLTTDGTERQALRRGFFTFTMNAVAETLHVYKFLDARPMYQHYLFVPFLDQTAGKESYGGGRYLDLNENESGVYVLDFNTAYNPSCAYGRSEFRCPLPPAENVLRVAVRAGEKVWK